MGFIDKIKGIFTKDATEAERVDSLADRIQKDGKVSEQELADFEAAILEDEHVTPDEQRLLDSVVARVHQQEAEKAGQVHQIAARIQQDGIVTREELAELNAAIMADGNLSVAEQQVLQDIVHKIQSKKLKEA